jgi:hypothetical protein
MRTLPLKFQPEGRTAWMRVRPVILAPRKGRPGGGGWRQL